MGEYKTHDSWGMVGICHQHHGGRQLFGSDVTNYNTICLRIKTAQCSRELGRDWIMGDKTLVEITLSANQFADLLTNANVGDGVPCTIEYVADKGMIKYQPQKPKIEIIEEEHPDRITISRHYTDTYNDIFGKEHKKSVYRTSKSMHLCSECDIKFKGFWENK